MCEAPTLRSRRLVVTEHGIPSQARASWGRSHRVLTLTTVDNSDVVPTRLTAHPTLLMISKLFLPHLSSNEDSDVPSCVHVPARGLPLPFAGEARASLLVPSSTFLLTRRGQA